MLERYGRECGEVCWRDMGGSVVRCAGEIWKGRGGEGWCGEVW